MKPLALVILATATLVASGGRAEGGSIAERASTFKDLFGEANVAASRGEHETAIARYGELVAAGVQDPDVYFNLGTALAQAGDYPRAILSYERAVTLEPSDRKISENLRNAERALEESRAEAEGEASIHRNSSISDAIYQRFTEDGLAYALVIANLVFFGVLAWAWLRRRRGRAFYGLLICSALLLLFSATGLGVKAGLLRDGPRAVVLEDRVALLEGPDPRAGVRGEARGGDRAQLIASDREFVKLRVIGGAEGWAPSASVGRIDQDDATH